MPVHTPVSRQSLGRTFTVAATLLAAVAALQAGVMAWAFLGKSPAPPAHIDVAALQNEVPPPQEPDDALAATDPLGGDDAVEVTANGPRPVPVRMAAEPAPPPPVAEPLIARAPAPSAPPSTPFALARPTPVPLSTFTPKTDPRVTELIEQGKLLRNTGDTAGALVKFREAAAMDAGNPTSIAEMAYTFEKMSMPDKAAEQWRRIIAMGEGAGVLYSAARSKLDMAVAGTMRRVAPPSGGDPVPDGKTLALGAISMIDDQDPAAERKFVLQIPIHAKAGASIAVRDVRVYVHFFEKLNGKDIVRTAANVNTRWNDPPVDWRADGTETLDVTYDLPLNGSSGEPREYYGYIVRLFYADDPQDTRAEPAALLQKFPAPENTSD